MAVLVVAAVELQHKLLFLQEDLERPDKEMTEVTAVLVVVQLSNLLAEAVAKALLEKMQRLSEGILWQIDPAGHSRDATQDSTHSSRLETEMHVSAAFTGEAGQDMAAPAPAPAGVHFGAQTLCAEPPIFNFILDWAPPHLPPCAKGFP